MLNNFCSTFQLWNDLNRLNLFFRLFFDFCCSPFFFIRLFFNNSAKAIRSCLTFWFWILWIAAIRFEGIRFDKASLINPERVFWSHGSEVIKLLLNPFKPRTEVTTHLKMSWSFILFKSTFWESEIKPKFEWKNNHWHHFILDNM